MSGKYEKRRRGSARKLVFAMGLLLVLLTVSAGGIGTAVAKYIWGSTGQTLVKAPEFYFTSDLLGATAKNYVLNSSAKEVTFTLSNAADALRCSEVEIAYSVTANGGTLEGASGTLAGNEISSKNVTLSGMEPGKTYTVTATGTAGYSQTLSANFSIAGNDENVYKHLAVASDGTMVLTVWTHNVQGNLSVIFPETLIPDNTNVGMGEVYSEDNGGAHSFEVQNFGKYASQTYRFFHNGGEYSVENFAVKVSKDNQEYLAAAASLP